MNGSGVIVSLVKTNLVESIAYKLEQDRVGFQILPDVFKIKGKDKPDWIIFVDTAGIQQVLDYVLNNGIKLLIISQAKPELKKIKSYKNTIVTNLINDNESYTPTQKELLFRKGIYSVINNYVSHFVSDIDPLADGLITDITEVEVKPQDWTFEFSSLNESYSWLSRHNHNQSPKVELRVINFFLDRLYNDSDKEIRYLVERINDIRNGQKSVDIFVCTKDELDKYRKNIFFRNLVKNISKNYKIYLVNKDELKKTHLQILKKITYGIIIFEDCVYRDYLDNETSLGYVDCRQETVRSYQKLFDNLLEELAVEIKKE